MEETPLDHIYRSLEPSQARTVSIRFDNILVFQWIDGVPQSFTSGFHSQYVPEIIEIWIDDTPVYGMHPSTQRVYLSRLPFIQSSNSELTPQSVSQLITYFPLSSQTDERTEF